MLRLRRPPAPDRGLDPADGDCATTGRTTANLGGAAPYWTSYTYTAGSQRNTETTHTADTSTTTTSCYRGGTTQPHTLLATVTSGTCTGATAEYGYDAEGNTTSRPDGSTTQNLDWDAEGKLSRLTENPAGAARATDYLYGADGNLLLRRSAASDGETVLYLGATEVHLKSGKKWAARSYTFAGSTVAVRSNQTGTEKISYLAGDQHGSASVAIASDTQALTKRYLTPFGAQRGSGVSWVDDKAFLGKSADADTGLTHVDAREYDPLIGQFISVDPVLDTTDGQSLNGYAYAGNNPATYADPTGERTADCVGGWNECGPVRSSSTGNNGGSIHNRGTLSKSGSNKEHTPQGGAWGSKSSWKDAFNLSLAKSNVLLGVLTKGACSRGLVMSCALWKHYGDDTGTDFELSANTVDNLLGDKGVKGDIADQLEAWKAEASGRCEKGEECIYSADSGWRKGEFQGMDAKNAIGKVKWRINASVTVGADRRVSATYSVDLFKNWNFDRGKKAEIPYLGVTIDLGQFLDLHEHGMAREYDMYGTSSMHTS